MTHKLELIVSMVLVGCIAEGCSSDNNVGGESRQELSKSNVVVVGLLGSGLVLQNTVGDILKVSNDGTHEFAGLADTRAVSVLTNPINPIQRCDVVGSASGTDAKSSAATVVRCVTESPRFAYTLNFRGKSSSFFRVNGLTGELQLLESVNTGLDPVDVGTDANDRYWFVVNRGAATLSAFAIDANSGHLSELIGSPYSTGGVPGDANVGPHSLTVHPNGRFVYVSNGGGANNLAGFKIDNDIGTLTSIPGAPFGTGKNPAKLTIDRKGNFAYLANFASNDIYVYRANSETGVLTEIRELRTRTEQAPGFSTLDKSGRFLLVTNTGSESVSIFAVNSASGALEKVAGSPIRTGKITYDAIAIHPSGRFFFVRSVGGPKVQGVISSFQLDAKSGSVSVVNAPIAIRNDSTRMEMDPAGRFVYVLYGWRQPTDGKPPVSKGSILIYSVDSKSGALTRVNDTVETPYIPFSMRVDPSGRFAYVTSVYPDMIFAYRIDQITGTLSPLPGRPAVVAGAVPVSITIVGSPFSAN